MAAGAWGRLRGCKAVSSSSHSSPSLRPQPLHLPGYRCVEAAQVGIHACTAWAARRVMSHNSMRILKLKSSRSQLCHHQTRVPRHSVGGWEMPILFARLRWLLDPNWSSATDWCIPKATWRSCQPADLLIPWKASPVLVQCVLAAWQEESHRQCSFSHL